MFGMFGRQHSMLAMAALAMAATPAGARGYRQDPLACGGYAFSAPTHTRKHDQRKTRAARRARRVSRNRAK